MKIANALAAAAILAVATMSATCEQRDTALPTAPSAAALNAPAQQSQEAADGELPFHSEVAWQFEQVPLPAGRCLEALPAGLSYLWLSRIQGTATSTHLGTGPYYVELCVFGVVTDPSAPPPANGTPTGWSVDVQVWTAANGDRLRGTGRLVGFTAPPGTPDFQFIESLQFLDGGTGRFEYADGEGTGIVDPVAQTAVYDGWIRYGRKQK